MNSRLLRNALLTAVFLAFQAPACAAYPSEADSPEENRKPETQDPDEKVTTEGFRFVFRRNPSLRFGKVLRVDFRGNVQADYRSFSPELDTKEGAFDLNRARVGIEGKFLKHFEYQIEYELKDQLRPLDDSNNTPISDGWRDVYVNFTYVKNAQIQGGKFKIPFSLDQLTSHRRLDFVYRSRIGDTLAPGRDIGLMLHGRFFKRGLGYEAGLFESDGENSKSSKNPGAERTFAGRLTATPLRPTPLPAVIKTAEFGFAVASSTVPEGPKGLRGRTAAHEKFFPLPGDWMFVHGERLRVGLEFNWNPGPFSLKSEFIHLRDQRLGQSIRGADLPDLISRGWYVSGTWAVTGETKAGGIEPRREFLRNGGFGAVELAGRYEQIRFGSSEHPGPPLRHQRAPNILPTSDRAWTFGVNWYLNRWLKVQFNGIREKIEDTVRGPIPGEDVLWARVLRLQVAM